MYDTSYYTYGYDTVDTSSFAGGLYIFYLLFIGFVLFCTWKLFTKAGREGWKCLIPIYGIVVEFQIAGLPGWYAALLLVPFANVYALVKLYIELAHKFGKSTGFGVLTFFFTPICTAILALGSARYEGEIVNNVNVNSTMVNNNNINYNAQVNNQTQPMNNQVSSMNNSVVQEPVMQNVQVNNQVSPMDNQTQPMNNQFFQAQVPPVNNSIVQEPTIQNAQVNNQVPPMNNQTQPMNNQVSQTQVPPVDNNNINNNIG